MATPRVPGFSTRSIHADRAFNTTRGVAPAIHQTSTFRWDSPDDGARFAGETAPSEFYARLGHPNARQLEALVASLEGAEAAMATASGMAAMTAAVMPNVSAGDHIVAARTLYGDVQTLVARELPRFGVACTVVASSDPAAFAAAMRPTTKLVVIETPANPTLECVDIAAVARIAHDGAARLVVDSTFATPVNTRPLELGADLVVHSATKYLGGHSDVLAGVLAGDAATIARAWEHLHVTGAAIGAFDAWLVARGIRTLSLRMAQHNASALEVARFLSTHPRVAQVNHPGLASHPSHAIAARQMRGFGGMLSLVLRDGEPAARRFVGALKLVTRATSLGGVESLCQFPAVLSRLTPAQQRAAGVDPGLVRLSVGCEDLEDLLADLGQALEAT